MKKTVNGLTWCLDPSLEEPDCWRLENGVGGFILNWHPSESLGKDKWWYFEGAFFGAAEKGPFETLHAAMSQFSSQD